MKVVLLAGGLGTRISEESHLRPKPMIEIGEKPILWHIMKEYSHYGHTEFIICCGYKQHMIKEYFADYYLNNSDITFDFTDNNKMIVHSNVTESWKVTLVDTGLNTMTGGRIKRIKKYTEGEPFLMTYGDGVCDVDINDIIKFHNINKKIVTMTAVNVEPRFGILDIDSKTKEVKTFTEKPKEQDARINAGYMVIEPEIFDYIEGDDTVFEQDPLHKLSKIGQLDAYEYDGFWQCMDTQRERDTLQRMWNEGKAPWKCWE